MTIREIDTRLRELRNDRLWHLWFLRELAGPSACQRDFGHYHRDQARRCQSEERRLTRLLQEA